MRALAILAAVFVVVLAGCTAGDPTAAPNPTFPIESTETRTFQTCGGAVSAALQEHKHVYVDSTTVEGDKGNIARYTRKDVWFPVDVLTGINKHCGGN